MYAFSYFLFYFFNNDLSDAYEENIVGIDSEDENDFMNYDSEDEDEDEDGVFIDDDDGDLGIFPTSPVPNSGGSFWK